MQIQVKQLKLLLKDLRPDRATADLHPDRSSLRPLALLHSSDSVHPSHCQLVSQQQGPQNLTFSLQVKE